MTLKLVPLILNSITLTPQRVNLNSRPQTSYLKPQTSNLKPQTSNPNPSPKTRLSKPQGWRGWGGDRDGGGGGQRWTGVITEDRRDKRRGRYFLNPS